MLLFLFFKKIIGLSERLNALGMNSNNNNINNNGGGGGGGTSASASASASTSVPAPTPAPDNNYVQLSSLIDTFSNSTTDIKNHLTDLKSDLACIKSELEVYAHTSMSMSSSHQRINPDVTIAEIASLLQASNYEGAFNKVNQSSYVRCYFLIILQHNYYYYDSYY